MKTKLLLLIFFLGCTNIGNTQEIYSFKTSLIGSPFELIVVATDSTQANLYFEASVQEVKRIELLISEWKPETEVSKVNDQAGISAVKVSKEVFDLVERALKISKISEGAFDLTFASMEKLWQFDKKEHASLPSPEIVSNNVKNVGYPFIQMDKKNQTIYITNPKTKIGLGGIGQGYIADKISEKLKGMGCTSAVVNVSGDVYAWGKKPDQKPWQVAITNPMNTQKIIGYFPLENSAVETSGNYEKYFTHQQKRYAHIIDPRTGYPVQDIVSVSVFAKTTELSDALATAVFVLGVTDGLALLNQLDGIEGIIIDDRGKIYTSNHIKIKPEN
ncbi:MAG: FAD:protein FMN transferase [Flavobacteriales bacterium]|nr:FAD:protein FMN transferase [Flavobacteriales bacterium]